MSRQSQNEAVEALTNLRRILPRKARIGAVLRHRSRSGMLRYVDLVLADEAGFHPLGGFVARAIGRHYDRERSGILMRGVGYDPADELVSAIQRLLGDGWELRAEWI